MRHFWLAAILFICSSTVVSAAVYVNEFSSYQSSGDWVELYANSETDISGWILKDSSSEIKTIPSSTKIGTPSASILVFTVSNRLNRDQDLIELYQQDGLSLVDSISYGFSDAICAPGEGQSIARQSDGDKFWIRFVSSTQGITNSGTESPCPTPTPSPSPTPTPPPTPTPSPSPSPTPTPKPSIKPSPPAPSVAVGGVGSPPPTGTVAGETTQIDLSGFGVSPTPSGEPSLQGQALQGLTLNKTRAKTAILVGSGLTLISLSLFFGYRQYLATHKGSDLDG